MTWESFSEAQRRFGFFFLFHSGTIWNGERWEAGVLSHGASNGAVAGIDQPRHVYRGHFLLPRGPAERFGGCFYYILYI